MIRIDYEAWPELYSIRMQIKLMEFFPFNKELTRPLKRIFNIMLIGFYKDLQDKNFLEIIKLWDDFRADINIFYNFLFTIYPEQKFEVLKTKGERELIKLLKSKREELTSRERLTIAKELGGKISRRYFKHPASKINNKNHFLNYFGHTLGKMMIVGPYEVDSLLTKEGYEKSITDYYLETKQKLIRNKLSEEGLELYKEIIVEIAKVENIGHKPNLQRICDDIAGKKNLKTDLRKAFDQWRKRNTNTYKKLLLEAKAEKK